MTIRIEGNIWIFLAGVVVGLLIGWMICRKAVGTTRTIKDQHDQLQRIARDHITWEEH